jgi:hypothetical protein
MDDATHGEVVMRFAAQVFLALFLAVVGGFVCYFVDYRIGVVVIIIAMIILMFSDPKKKGNDEYNF